MAQHALGRFSFESSTVMLDGEPIFNVPTSNPCMNGINVMGCLGDANGTDPVTLFVGTGNCCHGHVYKLTHAMDKDFANLVQIISVDLNVMDLLPVSVDYEKVGFPNEDGVLVAGYGCAGSGVRLLGTYYPRTINVMPEELFRRYMPKNGDHAIPRFRIDARTGIIHLNFMLAGYRERPGKQRDPKLPKVLVDTSTEEPYVSSDVYRSADLTPMLSASYVRLTKTAELLTAYQRITLH